MIRHSAGITHDEIRHLVYLRIVRECGLPDSYTNVLKVGYLFLGKTCHGSICSNL